MKKTVLHYFTRDPMLWLRQAVSFALLVGSWLPVQAQDDDESTFTIRHSVEAGVAIGGQLANETFVLKTGRQVQYAAEVPVSSRVHYGLGVGLEIYENERFLPIFASFKGFLKKKDNTPYLAAQLGYAVGWSRPYTQYQGYDFDGGVLFSPGFGYRFDIKNKFSALIGVHYKHQFAKSRYETFDGQKYPITLNYDLIAFRAGILF